MQMFNAFKIRTPPAECEVSGTNHKMCVRFRGDAEKFRVKAATSDRNWFYIVRTPDTLRAQFVHRGSDTCYIGEDQGGVDLSPYDGVQHNGLEEGKTESVSCKEETRPAIGSNQLSGRKGRHWLG